MRSSSKVRFITRTTAAAALLVAVVTIAPISGAGASDATTTSTTTAATTAGSAEERTLQCESGVVTSPDGTQTSSATLERVPADTEPGPGCHIVK